MASKQTQAKNDQVYNPKPVPAVCSTCKHFQCDRVMTYAGDKWRDPKYDDKNLRCAIGGFAVKKHGSCKLHEFS